MKTLRFALYLLMLSVFAACSSGGDDGSEPTPPQPDKPTVTFPAGTDTAPVVAQTGGTSTLNFIATQSWSASVKAASRALDWISVSPTSGGAGNVTLKITTQPNDTPDERNAAITISSGGHAKTVTVSQKQKNALTVTSNKVQISAVGGTVAIEVKANVDYQYEIEERAKSWITKAASRALETTYISLQIAENESEEKREGKITIKSGELSEEVTIYQEGDKPTIVLTEDEYMVGSDGETIKIELKSNVEYTIQKPASTWITEVASRAFSTHTHYFTIEPNDTYDARTDSLFFINEENGIREKVTITQVQQNAIIIAKNEYNVSPKGGTLNFAINTNVDFTVSVSNDWIKQTESRGLTEKPLSFDIAENTLEKAREGVITITDGSIAQEIKVIQDGLDSRAQKHREALIALYKAMDGDNWENNTNWCSDKPIYEWYGVNHNVGGDWKPIKVDYVVSLYLFGNLLTGELPEETSILMDYCNPVDVWNLGFNLNNNYICSPIPESYYNHPRWKEIGWNVISQLPTDCNFVPRPVLDRYELKIEDKNIKIFNSEESTTIHKLLAQNEITLVYNQTAGEACLGTVDFTKERVNMHLDYHNKGLSTVYCFWEYNSISEIKEWIQQSIPEHTPKDILFTSDFGHRGGAHFPQGNIYMYDKQGNLIFHMQRTYGEGISEALFNSKVDSVLRSRLGEPEEHEPFEMENYYTSTDYSKDGEVFVMQKATKGKGVDLLFMGDAFVDRDMNDGGLYERTMLEGMEKLFSMEPYKSLRDRFNVYGIKVVSPNSVFENSMTETKINWNDEICFEYANMISELNKDRLMISVVFATSGFWSAETRIYEDGSFVAYMSHGVDDVLIHEMGGHGIAWLKDEYVNDSNISLTLPEEMKQEMEKHWQNWGWGANVDWRNDPATVKWAHFLKDERYKDEELGLYEGAYLYGFGAYRPTENSMMRYNDSPFNAPSREQIYKVVMQMSEGKDWKYNYEDFVKFDEPSRNTANARSLRIVPTEEMRKKWNENHRSPVFKKGTWRDAVKKGGRIPLR